MVKKSKKAPGNMSIMREKRQWSKMERSSNGALKIITKTDVVLSKKLLELGRF